MSTVRRSANFIVESVCPPEMHNVLWMDISIPGNPILKVWQKGKWIPTFTDQSKVINLMAHSIYDLTQECVSIVKECAKQGSNPFATNTAIYDKLEHIDFSEITEGIEDIKEEVSEIQYDIEHIDFTSLAKQGTNASATLTTTQAAVVDGNDTAVSVAKDVRSEVGSGSDTAAETGTLFAVVKWIKDKVKSIFNLIGSPASGQPATLFAAIAAGGGGGSADALEQEVETGKTAIADAIVQKGGTATATDSLAQLATDVQNIPNVTKTFVQTDFIEQWVGDDTFDALKVIHNYYNPLYPQNHCYILAGGTTISIASGNDKLLYYNEYGVLTTIDNPDGYYTIFAAPNSDYGFALLQTSANIITSLSFTASDLCFSIAAYNANITISPTKSTSLILAQFEDCDITFAQNETFKSSGLTAFVTYGNTNIANIPTQTFYGSRLTYISLEGNIVLGEACFYGTQLRSVNLKDVERIDYAQVFYNNTSLAFIELHNLKKINSTTTFFGCTMLKGIILPELEVFNGNQTINNCSSLEYIYMPKLSSLSGYNLLTGAANLIDIVFGQYITANININTWNPTNALLNNSSSLVYPWETFANNREKLLYNIRNHIAANLPDRTGLSAITITFISAVKAAIQADTATAQAFTSKNYTIA